MVLSLLSPVLLWLSVSVLVNILLTLFMSMFMKEEFSVCSNTQFECGMDSMHPNTVPSYMHFYMVAILFLVFDMEFVIGLPLINLMGQLYFYPFWWTFIVILSLGLIIEIVYGSINWKE